MQYNTSSYLKKRFYETVDKMVQDNLKKKYIEGEEFFVTTDPDSEPEGTLFLGAFRRDGAEYVLCQKI
ncbi:MAG: hypothetical protein R6V55_03555 [Desulfovermiculus sp.]